MKHFFYFSRLNYWVIIVDRILLFIKIIGLLSNVMKIDLDRLVESETRQIYAQSKYLIRSDVQETRDSLLIDLDGFLKNLIT